MKMHMTGFYQRLNDKSNHTSALALGRWHEEQSACEQAALSLFCSGSTASEKSSKNAVLWHLFLLKAESWDYKTSSPQH